MIDSEWDDYESGPFCEHWSHPWDCEEQCGCGHQCSDHTAHADERRCNVDDCRCADFTKA